MSDLSQGAAGREALERDVAELRARFADVESMLAQAPIDTARVVHWRRAANSHLNVARAISLRRPGPALTRQVDTLQAAIDAVEILPAAATAPPKARAKKRPDAAKSGTGKRPNPTKSGAKKGSTASKSRTGKPKRYVAVFTDEPQTCKVCGQKVPPFKRHADILDSHRDKQQRWCQGGVLPPEVARAMSRIAAAKGGDSPGKEREDTRPIRVVSGGLPTLGRGR